MALFEKFEHSCIVWLKIVLYCKRTLTSHCWKIPKYANIAKPDATCVLV